MEYRKEISPEPTNSLEINE